jgi:hypothetical protein
MRFILTALVSTAGAALLVSSMISFASWGENFMNFGDWQEMSRAYYLYVVVCLGVLTAIFLHRS